MTETKRYINSLQDRVEVTFHPEEFYDICSEQMQWKELEREFSRQLKSAHDKMFGEDMTVFDKLHNIACYRREAIYELKRHYYKTNKSLYTITIVINGYLK